MCATPTMAVLGLALHIRALAGPCRHRPGEQFRQHTHNQRRRAGHLCLWPLLWQQRHAGGRRRHTARLATRAKFGNPPLRGRGHIMRRFVHQPGPARVAPQLLRTAQMPLLPPWPPFPRPQGNTAPNYNPKLINTTRLAPQASLNSYMPTH